MNAETTTAPLLDLQAELPPKAEVMLEGVAVEKLFAQPSLQFLQSLKLRNLNEKALRKASSEIGNFVYFFKVAKTTEGSFESWM